MGGSTGILQPIPGGSWSPAGVLRSIITISSSDSRRGTNQRGSSTFEPMSETLLIGEAGAGCDGFVRSTRGGQTAASYAVGFEKNCLDNDTRLYLMSVPTEKIVQCIEFKNVSRGSSLHLQSEARSGRYSCLCVVESN